MERKRTGERNLTGPPLCLNDRQSLRLADVFLAVVEDFFAELDAFAFELEALFAALELFLALLVDDFAVVVDFFATVFFALVFALLAALFFAELFFAVLFLLLETVPPLWRTVRLLLRAERERDTEARPFQPIALSARKEAGIAMTSP